MTRLALRANRVPRQRKGIHPPSRRAQPAASRASLGGRRQGLGPNGGQSLADLFDGRSQLIVYHFMFHPSDDVGCPHCSLRADNFNGIIPHLKQRDLTMIAVSRAPYSKLASFQKRMGWTFQWVSS